MAKKFFSDLKNFLKTSEVVKKNLMMVYLVLFSAAILAVWAVIYFDSSYSSVMPSLNISSAKTPIYLTFDFGENKKTRCFSTFISPDKRVRTWSLLQQATAYAGMDLQVTDGYVPAVIDGVPKGSGNDLGVWQLYVNDKKYQLKPFEVTAGAGDTVTFKFEKIAVKK